MKHDYRTAGLDARLLTLLSFAETLTREPDAITERDVEGLRRVDYDDTAILFIVLQCGQFNYLNRVADGIGIPLDYESDLVPAATDGAAAAPAAARPERPRADPRRSAWIAQPAADTLRDDEDAMEGPTSLWRVLAEVPQALAVIRAWRAHQLKGTPALDASRRAGAALLSAGLQRCEYSARWFREAFERAGGAAADAEHLARGEAPPGDLILDHVRRLTLMPWTTRREHVDALRGAGLADRDILQLTTLVAYVSFEVRVILGLGLV